MEARKDLTSRDDSFHDATHGAARSLTISRPPTAPAAKAGLRINEMIDAAEVLLIDADGAKLGVVGTRDALARAEAAGLDLVEVSPQVRPPVCKILDYGKYKYQAQKRANVARKKQKVIDVKEVKIRPNIDTHDYDVKLRNVLRFLGDGDKVKITVRFRGREMAHPERGAQLLNRLCSALMEKAKIESSARMEGRQLTMVLIPASHNGGRPMELLPVAAFMSQRTGQSGQSAQSAQSGQPGQSAQSAAPAPDAPAPDAPAAAPEAGEAKPEAQAETQDKEQAETQDKAQAQAQDKETAAPDAVRQADKESAEPLRPAPVLNRASAGE